MEATGTAGLRGGSIEADDVTVALEGLIVALQASIQVAQRAQCRADFVLDQRRFGRLYRDIVPQPGEPLIVEMMRESLTKLGAAVSQLQHAEAKALHDEGLTTEQIGRLFGVTHQRVSAMLKRARAENLVTPRATVVEGA